MARMGRFGRRRPSGGGNLAALVASLMREQRAAEDRAIFDAWQNGGQYKGKLVTDDMLLGHIKNRRNGFAKDDPLWDQWNNTLIQHEFSIGEQKIGLKFKQGKVSAGAVASFYRGQLSKIPKDSAFYREVAGRAADWAKSAASSARGRARSAANKALQEKADRAQSLIDEHSNLEAYLTRAAQQAGLIWGSMTLAEADATDLQNFFGNSGLTYKGQPVTPTMLRDVALDAKRGYDQAVRISIQAGHAPSTIREARNRRDRFVQSSIVPLNALDDRAKYEIARENWIESVTSANNDPFAILEANRKYAAALGGIHQVASSPAGKDANDPQFIGALVNEINAVVTGKSSGPTVADLYPTSLEGGEVRGQSVTGASDADSTAESVAITLENAQKITPVEQGGLGLAYYGQATPGGAFEVIDYPPQAALDPTGRHGLGKDKQVSILEINGIARNVTLAGTSVFARTTDEGGLAGEASGQPIGYVFTDPVSRLTRYGIVAQDGSMVFTLQNPFAGGLERDEKGNFFVLSDPQYLGLTGTNGEATFLHGAGLNAQAINALSGAPDPNIGILTTSPLMVDTTVATDDILAYTGIGNPVIDAYIEKRRKGEDQAGLESTYQDRARGIERTAPNFLDATTDALAQSPVGQVIGGALGQVTEMLRGVSLPGAGSPTRTKDDTFLPPAPPAPPPAPTIKPPEERRTAGSTADGYTAIDEDRYVPKTRTKAPDTSGGSTSQDRLAF